MKKIFLILLGLTLVGGLSLWVSRGGGKAPSPTALVPKQKPEWVNVFQRTFWRTPSEADSIVNAGRREWTGEDGIKCWESFILVKASPALLKYVRDDNAFGLVAATSVEPVPNAPDWFAYKPADVTCLRAPTGRMRLLFSKTSPLLYATASGGMFRPGAPELPTSPATGSRVSAGRLQSAPPPTPSHP
jgi:hypothetical protein